MVEALLGAAFAPEPARVSGWERVRVRDADYPGLRAAPGAETDGVVYRGLDSGQLALLDGFEGSLYRRMELEVASGRRALRAQVWVVRPEHLHRLGDEPWSAEEFEARHLDDWVRHCAALGRRWRSGG